MTLDQAIRDRIEQDFETSLCVEAGAGTGKTSLMVRRVVNQVLRGISISRIVAITFTEKAAGELKQRIRAALENERSKSSEYFDLLTRALRELDTAQISTIHGFAAAILRERPVEAIVDPNFNQLDELGLSLLLDQIWERWLDAMLASSNEVLKLALAADLNPDRMYQLFRSLYDHREHIAGLAASSYSFDRAREETSRILGEAESFLKFCKDPKDNAWQQWTRTLQSFRGVSAVHPTGLVKFFKELKLDKNAGNKTRWQGDYCRKLREKADDLREIRSNFHASLLSGVLLLLRGAVDDAEEEKSRRNVLDFDDLLLKARDLLQRDKATRGYFQELFLSVIVDEFQDTDPLQVEIVFFLCEQEARAERWEEVTLKPGKLCIVGDPKQSIYRFRRADIETYMKAQDKISLQGELLPIQENFRSARPLVDWVNDVFSRLIQEEENYQPRYQRLLTSDQSSSSPVPRVTLLCSADEIRTVKECRQQEAAALVSLLRRIRQERWPLRRKEAGKPPEAQWGDIAILFSTLTESLIYESALRAAEIPYRLDGGRQFFARQEIHALVACLQAIDDPADEIALVAALRSLFFGVSDDDIFRHRRRAGALSYYGRGSLSPEEGVAASESDRELGRALLLLRTLHEERNLVSLAFTLERLYRETDALEKHLLTWSGRQAVANLQKALLRARAFEEAGPATFRRFVRWLYQLEEFGRQEPESTLVETDDDAVNLLTIHKAKGLEFPVVILANLSGGMHDGVSVLLNRKLSSLEFHISAGDDGNKTVLETFGFQEMKEREGERQEAEKKRLLYVAATRARDYLVVSTFRAKNRPGLLEHLLPALPSASSIPDDAQEVVVDQACEESNLQPESLAVVVARRQQAEETEVEREAAPVRLWRVPPCSLPPDPELSANFEPVAETDPDWETQLRRWRDDRVTLFERASVSWSPSTASAAKAGNEIIASFAAPAAAIAYDSTRLGSAFHRLMYRIPVEYLTDPSVADHLRPLADQIALEYALPDAGELLKLARRPMPEPLAERLRSANRIHREVPFLLQLPPGFAREGKKAPALYEGIIDLVAEQADGSLLIVDYKTDRVAAGEIPARMAQYVEQERIYRAAAEQASGRNVSDVCFFFIRPGVAYEEIRN